MAKHKFSVDDENGDEVWSGSFSDGSIKNFPEEHRRPTEGTRHLYIDDVLVGVQTAEAADHEGVAQRAAADNGGN